MIIIREYYRGKIRREFHGSHIGGNSEGSIIIEPHWRDDSRITASVEITAIHLRQLRDACNQELERITGHTYRTTVTIK